MERGPFIGGFEIIVTSPCLFCYWIFGCIMKPLLERLGWEAEGLGEDLVAISRADLKNPPLNTNHSIR
jgi:hypothetical protein